MTSCKRGAEMDHVYPNAATARTHAGTRNGEFSIACVFYCNAK